MIIDWIMPLTLQAIQVGDGWRAGIGDPTFMGWFTVVAYLCAAICCAAAAQAERRTGRETDHHTVHPVFWTPSASGSRKPPPSPTSGRRVVFWWLLAAAMTFLAINKQLDLQTLLPVIGRQVAKEQGWYEDRHHVQQAFVIGVAGVGLAILALVTFLFRSNVRRSPLAPLGLVFLFLFVLIRASSFHKVDVVLSENVLGLRINWILELGGIACVFGSAIHRIVSLRNGRRD